MRLAGILFILLSSVVTGALLDAEAKRGPRELSSFVGFLRTLRTRLECFLESPERVASDYRDPCLEKTGFLEPLREGRTLHYAYCSARKALSLSEDADKILSDLFSSFGRGYLSSEIRAIDGALSALSKSLETETKRAESKGRALKICAPTLGMGLVILLI